MRRPEDELAAHEEAGLLRGLRPLIPGPPPTVSLEGRSLLNFSSNDYLGLSQHQSLREASRRALSEEGSGTTASRLICGSTTLHQQLEDRIAELKLQEAALSFSSGYATAVGVLPALLKKGDTVILDKLCHASLIDGARLSGATLRVFPHNNLKRLETILDRVGAKSDPDARVLVVTESIFSMEGDRAPLQELAALTARQEALLLVDEAHALGLTGANGQGLIEELGLQKEIPLQMGTLGKAAGAAGGYLTADRCWIDLIINRARSFIFSTAPPPAQTAAALAGLNLISSSEGQDLREKLWTNLRHFSQFCGQTPESAIVPIMIGENERTVAASEALLDAGFFVPAIRFPTVPRGTARLRITISAAHNHEHIEVLGAELARLDLVN